MKWFKSTWKHEQELKIALLVTPKVACYKSEEPHAVAEACRKKRTWIVLDWIAHLNITCMYVCGVSIKEGGRELVHCTLSQWKKIICHSSLEVLVCVWYTVQSTIPLTYVVPSYVNTVWVYTCTGFATSFHGSLGWSSGEFPVWSSRKHRFGVLLTPDLWMTTERAEPLPNGVQVSVVVETYHDIPIQW